MPGFCSVFTTLKQRTWKCRCQRRAAAFISVPSSKVLSVSWAEEKRRRPSCVLPAARVHPLPQGALRPSPSGLPTSWRSPKPAGPLPQGPRGVWGVGRRTTERERVMFWGCRPGVGAAPCSLRGDKQTLSPGSPQAAAVFPSLSGCPTGGPGGSFGEVLGTCGPEWAQEGGHLTNNPLYPHQSKVKCHRTESSK